jgi:hypothetical protein
MTDVAATSYTYPTPTLEEVYLDLAWPGATVVVGIDHARRLIAESVGRLTWSSAGATWASLHKADPQTRYPAL